MLAKELVTPVKFAITRNKNLVVRCQPYHNQTFYFILRAPWIVVDYDEHIMATSLTNLNTKVFLIISALKLDS